MEGTESLGKAGQEGLTQGLQERGSMFKFKSEYSFERILGITWEDRIKSNEILECTLA